MEHPFTQSCNARNGKFEGKATIIPGRYWFVRRNNGRTCQYFFEKDFQSVWTLVGQPEVIEDWPPYREFDESDPRRIAERKRLEKENYREQVCDYVIRSQECLERYGCWKPPRRSYRFGK